MRNLHNTPVFIAAVLLAACSSAPPAAAPGATVVLAPTPASASHVGGKLDLYADAGGVRVVGILNGLPPGSQHGFHIHEKGDCSAADASSAGGHFNPDAAPHGRRSDAHHHAGDIDNIVADAAGEARVDVQLDGVTLGDGAADDILGKAFIVHAVADDYTSQPAGNAGARVACGIIGRR